MEKTGGVPVPSEERYGSAFIFMNGEGMLMGVCLYEALYMCMCLYRICIRVVYTGLVRSCLSASVFLAVNIHNSSIHSVLSSIFSRSHSYVGPAAGEPKTPRDL